MGKNASMMGLQAAAITAGFSLAAQVIEGDGVHELMDNSLQIAMIVSGIFLAWLRLLVEE